MPRSQISPADTLEVRMTTPTGLMSLVNTMGEYFLTTPGIKTIDSGSGPLAISYPPKPGDPGSAGGFK